jgi:phosphoglycolate phosphatase
MSMAAPPGSTPIATSLTTASSVQPAYVLAAFDFDGTLADTLPWFDGVIDEVAQRYGFRQVNEQEKAELRRQDARQILSYLGIPLWKAPAIMAHMRTLMNERSADVTLFSGIAQQLRALKAGGLRLALVSSNSAENVRRVLGDDLAALFDQYECGVDLFGKSSKLKRLRRHGGEGRMILVGDELRDIQAARGAGFDAGAVAWGYNHVDALRDAQPDRIFMEVEDLSTLLPG